MDLISNFFISKIQTLGNQDNVNICDSKAKYDTEIITTVKSFSIIGSRGLYQKLNM